MFNLVAFVAALFGLSRTRTPSTVTSTGAVYGPRAPSGPDRSNIEAAAYARAVQLVKLREGFRKRANGNHYVYLDSKGKATVGYGHLVLSRDNLKLGNEITEARAEAFFRVDFADAFAKAKSQATEIKKYTPDMIAALTSANFQLGNFKAEFYGTYPLLVRGDIRGFISRIWTKPWAQQTPVRVADLVETIKREFGVA